MVRFVDKFVVSFRSSKCKFRYFCNFFKVWRFLVEKGISYIIYAKLGLGLGYIFYFWVAYSCNYNKSPTSLLDPEHELWVGPIAPVIVDWILGYCVDKNVRLVSRAQPTLMGMPQFDRFLDRTTPYIAVQRRTSPYIAVQRRTSLVIRYRRRRTAQWDGISLDNDQEQWQKCSEAFRKLAVSNKSNMCFVVWGTCIDCIAILFEWHFGTACETREY